VTISPPISVTNSELCIFDINPGDPGRQWRRIFTMDSATYKLTATNPGQFFYNLSVTGTPGDEVDVTIELPWPFVTQGAKPIHVYDSLSFRTNNLGETCFVPGNTTQAIGNYVTLADYDVAPSKTGYVNGVPKMHSVTFTITIPDSGFAYINQHLDDGLKGRAIDVNGDLVPERYAKGGSEQALDPSTQAVLIPEMAFHEFCTFNSTGNNDGCDTIQNDNTWKKNPGVGGVMKYLGLEEPAKNLWVELYNPSNVSVGTGKSDEDGYYQIVYKHTGKQAIYTVRLSPSNNVGCTEEKSAVLKGNGFAETNFSDVLDPEDLPAIAVTCQPSP
jgi:hypothetical protein